MRIFLILALFTATAAHAYPIAPRTLWDLTWQADAIVVARVADVHLDEEGDGLDSIAELHALEWWKGDRSTNHYDVRFSPNWICPAPAVYEPGRTVVAFLREIQGYWVTTALSYGTRYPAAGAEMSEYREAVRSALTLQSGVPVPQAPEAAHSPAPAPEAWSIETARHRATRWDGLYALAHRSDPMHARHDRGRGNARPSPEALEELARIFIERPSFDRTLPMFLGILREAPNPEITRVAIDAFDTVMTHEVAPYWSDEVIDLLQDRLEPGSPEKLPAAKPTPEDALAEELKTVTEALASADAREAKFQGGWARFKEAFNLTPKPRADYVKKPRSRTGGETPAVVVARGEGSGFHLL